MQLDIGLKATYCNCPSFAQKKDKETPAQAAGRRYEQKVGQFLANWASVYKYDFKDHPWIQYLLPNGQLKYCQPDFVLLSRTDDNLLIIDAKVRHTRDVVSQLVRYRDIIRPLHPTFTPNLVEICRYFDSSECRMELLPELRPHNYNVAAVIFEPRQWMPATN
jgi:hypothetical protein